MSNEVSPMSDEFHDWLYQCPVGWIRERVDRNYVFYGFAIPDEVSDEACDD